MPSIHESNSHQYQTLRGFPSQDPYISNLLDFRRYWLELPAWHHVILMASRSGSALIPRSALFAAFCTLSGLHPMQGPVAFVPPINVDAQPLNFPLIHQNAAAT